MPSDRLTEIDWLSREMVDVIVTVETADRVFGRDSNQGESDLRRILLNLDVAGFSCTGRGPAWVMCEVPYEFAACDKPRSGQVELRFVANEGAWELEHVRIGEIRQ